MITKNQISTLDEIRLLFDFAVDLTSDSRQIIDAHSNTNITINFKRNNSLVSELDLKIEAQFRQKISQAFLNHGIIGEEYPAYKPESDYIWILNPIDGTQVFINHLPFFGTMIALQYKRNPIIGVIEHASLGGMRAHIFQQPI